MKSTRSKPSGFTIVELLVVIGVIGILATITVVSYNGVTHRANAAALESEVTAALKFVKNMKLQGNGVTFPSTLSSISAFATSSTLSYYYEANGNTFCIQSKKDDQSYSATSAVQTAVEGTCAENGLIGWWKLNGNANDSSGKGNNGTASATTSTTGQNAQANQAFAFSSGSTSNISVPTNTTLSTEPQSFSLWVRPTNWSSSSGSAMIAKRSNSTTNGYLITYATGSGTLLFDCGAAASPNRWVTSFTPSLNTWTHLVLTCSTDAGVALYVNGVFHSNRSTVNRSAMASTNPLKFGQDPYSSGLLYNGSLDDIRIYNRVINADEALALYSANAQ